MDNWAKAKPKNELEGKYRIISLIKYTTLSITENDNDDNNNTRMMSRSCGIFKECCDVSLVNVSNNSLSDRFETTTKTLY